MLQTFEIRTRKSDITFGCSNFYDSPTQDAQEALLEVVVISLKVAEYKRKTNKKAKNGKLGNLFRAALQRSMGSVHIVSRFQHCHCPCIFNGRFRMALSPPTIRRRISESDSHLRTRAGQSLRWVFFIICRRRRRVEMLDQRRLPVEWFVEDAKKLVQKCNVN